MTGLTKLVFTTNFVSPEQNLFQLNRYFTAYRVLVSQNTRVLRSARLGVFGLLSNSF